MREAVQCGACISRGSVISPLNHRANNVPCLTTTLALGFRLPPPLYLHQYRLSNTALKDTDRPCRDEQQQPAGQRGGVGQVPHFLPHQDRGEEREQEPGTVLLACGTTKGAA